jgi:hypothetical protein
MKEILLLIGDYWWILLVGAGLGVLAYYVPWVRTGLFRIWAALNKEKMRNDALMFIAAMIVKSTKNQLDDGWYNEAAKKLGYPVLPPQKTNTSTDKANK